MTVQDIGQVSLLGKQSICKKMTRMSDNSLVDLKHRGVHQYAAQNSQNLSFVWLYLFRSLSLTYISQLSPLIF